MNKLLPGKKRFYNFSEGARQPSKWSGSELDWKAKVVCEPCNNGWMSDIERVHAEPALIDLITGQAAQIPRSRARSIAVFAFKTAVIVDHMTRNRPTHFFPRSVRYRFRDSLEIPHNVRMWLAGWGPGRGGRCHSVYSDGDIAGYRVESYICTYGAANLLFQVVADVKPPHESLSPVPGFERLTENFWPRIRDGVAWPLTHQLATRDEFDAFAYRWRTVRRYLPVGTG